MPGKPAYVASQRTLQPFGAGSRAPNVVVFHTTGDVTKSTAIGQAMSRVAATMPGALTTSYFSTGDAMYVSRDRHTTFMNVYPPGPSRLDLASGAEAMRAAAARGLPAAVTAAVTVAVTGHEPLGEASKHGSAGGSSVAVEKAILNTFTLVWVLTYVTDVSIIVQFLIALVGLGVVIGYELLMIFCFRDELREGNDVEAALVETMTHAGRAVIVSGSTVAIGLLAMVALPLPLVRSMGIGGMLIPVVSVLASLTLLPALLAVLGTRINSVRVLPRRLVDRGHPEDGGWGRWARFVLRRPIAVGAVGLAIVAVLAAFGTQLNPNEAQLKNFPGTGTAITGRQLLADAGISPGVMKPLDVPVERGGNPQDVAAKLRAVPGVVGAVAPATWQRGADSLVEAFPAIDGSAPGIQQIVDRVNVAIRGTGGTLTGVAAVDRDFQHALFGSFPYVFALIVILTLLLLTRAFRSFVLALKAALLNLVSLAATFGVVVLVFQEGHGSSLWNVAATQSVIAWIPLMIFAFLYGLSMDYEVFLLSRRREAYDETGSTSKAIELGLARTGKLVTSGALILMFAFLVLSTSPGHEIKPPAASLAAGIILDATVIRALLVPALMRLLGEANWWMPGWAHSALRLRNPRTAPQVAAESA